MALKTIFLISVIFFIGQCLQGSHLHIMKLRKQHQKLSRQIKNEVKDFNTTEKNNRKQLKELEKLLIENEKMTEAIRLFQFLDKSVKMDDDNLKDFLKKSQNLSYNLSDFMKKHQIVNKENGYIKLEYSSEPIFLNNIKDNLTSLLNSLQQIEFSFENNFQNDNKIKYFNRFDEKINKTIKLDQNNYTQIDQEDIKYKNFLERIQSNDTNKFDMLFKIIKDISSTKFDHKFKEIYDSFEVIDKNQHQLNNTTKNYSSILQKIGEKIRFQIQFINRNSSLFQEFNNNQSLLLQDKDIIYNNASFNLSNQTVKQYRFSLQQQQKLGQFSEFAKTVKEDLTNQVDNIQINANKLYDQNLQNKLQKMNLQNFINEQVKIIDMLENVETKTKRMVDKISFLVNESQRITKNFHLMNNQSEFENARFKEYKQDGQKFGSITPSLLSSSSLSTKEFY